MKTRISAPAHLSATGIGRVSGLVISKHIVFDQPTFRDSFYIDLTSVPYLSSHTCDFINLGLISTLLIDFLQFYTAYWYERVNSPIF